MNITERTERYRQNKAKLVEQVKAIVKQGHRFSLGKKTSNLFRNRKPNSHRIDVSHFNHVLHVNTTEMWVEVEGMTPFETLVAETLKFNCLPAVVPELKSITVGGGLTGIAIESSSFRYGLVHENIIESEIMLGDGSIVNCTANNEHQDLFFAFPNTYGSLGYALKVKMKLIPAKAYVKLTHLHFTDPKAYFAKMQEVCAHHRKEGNIAYVDGVAFNERDMHLTLGEFVDKAPYTSNYKFMQIYYRSIKTKDEDYLTTADYIWRWDTDWFWCSKNFAMQYWWMRLLFGKWMLKSTSYWKVMNFVRNTPWLDWMLSRFSKPTETVIQDIEVPIDQAEAFHHFFHQEIRIKPVWMCPLQTFNPQVNYPFYNMDPTKLFVNFGFWEAIPTQQSRGYYNRLIERKVSELKGHKSLYSDVYYTEDEFWEIYSKEHYQQIKQKYDPKTLLKSWYQKVSVL